MNKFILIFLVTFASMTSFAGPRIVGNGGIAVQDGTKLYMLDLYERSIHNRPFYNPGVKPTKDVQESMTKIFGMADMDGVPVNRLIQKMSEVFAKNYDLGVKLTTALEKIDWRLVDSPLIPTDDVRTPLEGLELKQVAIRLNNTVYISEALWAKLDADNKIALLLHEAAYFLVKPTEVVEGVKYTFQDATLARKLTGVLFTKRFAIEGPTFENSGFAFNKSTFYKDAQTALSIVSLRISPPNSGFPLGLRLKDIYDSDLGKYKSIAELVSAYSESFQDGCEDAREYFTKKSSAPMIEVSLESYFSENSLRTTFENYVLQNGTRQTYLSIVNTKNPYSNERQISIPRKNFTPECVKHLTNELRKVMEPYLWQPETGN